MQSETDADEVSAKLLRVLGELVDEMHQGQPCPVHMHSHLERDLGLDSLARTELLLRLSREFATRFSDSALSEAETPLDLLREIGRSGVTPAGKPLDVLPEMSATSAPEQATTLIEVLEWHVARNPQRTHVLLYEQDEAARPISYGALLERAQRMAAGLVTRGLLPRQTVGLMLPSGEDYLCSFFGVMLAGGIPVPIYPPTRLAQLGEHVRRHAGILANAGASFLITLPQAKGIAALLQKDVPSLHEIVTPADVDREAIGLFYRPQADDIAFLQYTSGSTGDPKGVMLTHANLLANLRAMGRATAVSSRDVFVSWLPLYHDMGLIGAWFGSLYFGMLLVLMSPISFLARPARWLSTISTHRGTISAAPNFAYELCARKLSDADLAGIDLSSWRLALNGAEPVAPSTLDAFISRFAGCGFRRQAMSPVYGLAECSVGLSFPPPGRGPLIDVIERAAFTTGKRAQPGADDEHSMRIASCGRVLAQHEVRVVDETGDELPDRRIGRIEFRGPSATAGYYRNPEASRRLFRAGWLDSGDRGYSAGGEIYVTGRDKDLIIRAGRNIYPYELEQAVGDLAGIRKGCVAVFASTERSSATERLVVVAETHAEAADARAALQQRINEVALNLLGMPVDAIVLAPPNTILKTSSGKIRRAACQDAYARGQLIGKSPVKWQQQLKVGSALLRSKLESARQRSGRLLYSGWCWLLFGAIGLPVATLVALLRRPAAGLYLMHGATRLFLLLSGMPLRSSGLERLPHAPHILVVNHSSYLDALVLYAALPPDRGYRFAAKEELAAQPVVRAVLRGLGTLFVRRFSTAKNVQDIEKLIDVLGEGHSLMVFPEGTFTRESGLKAFYMGAFVAAARSGAPIQTAGLRGTRSALRDGSWMPRRAVLTVDIGPLLKASGGDWRSATRLRDQARGAVLQRCGEHDLMERASTTEEPG